MSNFCPHCTVIGPSQAQQAVEAERQAKASMEAMAKSLGPIFDNLRGVAVGLSREDWDNVIDGLVVLRAHAESNERAEHLGRLITSIAERMGLR